MRLNSKKENGRKTKKKEIPVVEEIAIVFIPSESFIELHQPQSHIG
jgi:hypothetical protein